MSKLETDLQFSLLAAGVPFCREYRFAKEHVGEGRHLRRRLNEAFLRDWRFDFAIVDQKIGIECEGGIWTGGAHVRGKHYQSDCEKYNAATALGWKVLRFTSDHIKKGEALRVIESVYKKEAA